MELPLLIPHRWREQPWWHPLMRGLALVLLVFIVVKGALYRVDQFRGVEERPLEPDVRRFYELARDMHHPYQSRHREPVHILLIKGSLALFGDRPASVLIPTLVASVLLIVVTFLFGWAVFGLPVGLGGAALVATNHNLIAFAARGYRLELFAALILAYVYVLFVAQRWRMRNRLVVAGVVGGLLLLVRITTVTLLVPALALFVWRERKQVEHQRKLVAWAVVSLLIGLALLAPYLVECWRVYGRPLIAVDRHAQWWAEAEAGRYVKSTAEETETSVFEYLFGRGHLWRTLCRIPRGYWVIARMFPWYAGSWKFLLPFTVAGMVMTAVRRQRYLFWVAFWLLLPFTVVMPAGGDVRFFLFLHPWYALWAVVGLYPLGFGVLYYVSGGKVAQWAGSVERTPAAEASSDEQPEASCPGD